MTGGSYSEEIWKETDSVSVSFVYDNRNGFFIRFQKLCIGS